MQHVLHPHVDRQLQWLAGVQQQIVLIFLDAGQTLVVHSREAQDVRGERALRVDPTFLALKVEPRYAGIIDCDLLIRR